LGLVMAIGIAACMIAALTFLPAVLNILAQFNWSVTATEHHKKKTQWRQCKVATGSEEPR